MTSRIFIPTRAACHGECFLRVVDERSTGMGAELVYAQEIFKIPIIGWSLDFKKVSPFIVQFFKAHNIPLFIGETVEEIAEKIVDELKREDAF